MGGVPYGKYGHPGGAGSLRPLQGAAACDRDGTGAVLHPDNAGKGSDL